jgi:hypothetical protein
MLIAPAVLQEHFPGDPPMPTGMAYERLRDRWLTFQARLGERRERAEEARRQWIDAVLEEFLGLTGWQKGSNVEERFRFTSPLGERLRPDRLLTGSQGEGLLAVTIDTAERIGIGRGRRAYARLVELLRGTGVSLGLLTNGMQFRLIYAGPDYDAWAEWEASTWFDEGEPRIQLAGLRLLLGRDALLSSSDGRPPLLAAIEASRTRQGELAQVLGEQVRQAVETLIQALDREAQRDPSILERIAVDPTSGQRVQEAEMLSALYQAATRLVMRMVVILYAEARDLLPRTLVTYHDSYSLEGLYRILVEAARHEGPRSLLGRRTAWPRVMALCRLIHEGSGHAALPIPRYGGTLFRPGDFGSRDPVLRALAAFEAGAPDDAQVLRVLRLLKIGRVRARQGRTARWVAGPVDFSDLRTEYIGIIYEGLLDYELRQVSQEDEGIVFLNVGREPALPLRRLEALTDPEIKDMITKLRKERAVAGPQSEEAAEEEDEEASEEEAEEEEGALVGEDGAEGPEEPEGVTTEAVDDDQSAVGRALRWAERAVEVAGIVRRPRGRNADLQAYYRERAAAARHLVSKVLGPGEFYLIRWGGTRKGSGTFYTRPGLAVPTTHRTLQPLVYETTPDGLRPKPPEEILSLKVVDPAMGSGSFLVAALRYLTEALAQSLYAHDRIRPRGDETVVTLPFGSPATGREEEELLPVPPDDERFDDLLRARLKRHVVERCIYGVDINPMAVELARLSLWLETMDPQLPFEFLDHKLKVGNSLVGCWFHLVEDYPARAWERQGGDGPNGRETRWLRTVLNRRVKPQLAQLINGAQQIGLWDRIGQDPRKALANLRAMMEAIHDLREEEREEAFRRLQESEEYRVLKRAFDRWCAAWFWPLEDSVEPLTPANYYSPPQETDEVVERLWRRERFFHWELEFPDVFTPQRRGFDAVLGNPPWEVQQAQSKEFFSNYDPLYRTYSKTEAVRAQKRMFQQDPRIQEAWNTYQATFKARSNWVAAAADPFNISLGRGGQGAWLRERWQQLRAAREAVAHPDHPYRYQGLMELNTYKMFLEVAHHLLRDGGRLGFIVPSGIHTDQGATDLRRLFLNACRWEWLYGFENRREIFPIHRSYKFNPVIVQKGGRTESVEAAFMRHNLAEWEGPEPPAIHIRVADIWRFAPRTGSFMEFRDRRDMEPTEKIYADHPRLGEVLEAAGARYRQEFNMTNDREYFTSRRTLEREGLLRPGEDTRDPRVRARLRQAGYLLLYEGKHFWQMNPYYEVPDKFVQGRKAEEKVDSGFFTHPRVAFRAVGRSTDQRTFIVSVLPPSVHGNSCPTFDGLGEGDSLRLAVILNSLVTDYIVRLKVSANLNWHYIETVPIAKEDSPAFRDRAYDLARRLQYLGADFPEPARDPLVDGYQRLAARLFLDALVADLYGLDPDDLEHIASWFPIFDREVPAEHRYPALVVQVYWKFWAEGPEAAEAEAARLVENRRMAGFGAGLEEIWVPSPSWPEANAEAMSVVGR